MNKTVLLMSANRFGFEFCFYSACSESCYALFVLFFNLA